MFLVKRGAGVEGPIALEETRDFTVAGSSYQDKTQAELGRRFELTIAIPGAQLPARSNVEVTVHVGFGKATTEPFRFIAMAPPSPTVPPKP
jgi:hypothetical protein